MTPEETKALLTEIVNQVNNVATVGAALQPQYAAAIAVGQALDKQLPGIVAATQSWIEGVPPTKAELAETAAKLAVLNDPNLP